MMPRVCSHARTGGRSQAARTELADSLRLQQATVTAKASRGAHAQALVQRLESEARKDCVMSEASPRFVITKRLRERPQKSEPGVQRHRGALPDAGRPRRRPHPVDRRRSGALPGAVETTAAAGHRPVPLRDGTTFYATAVRTIVGARQGGDAAAATIGWQIFDDLCAGSDS